MNIFGSDYAFVDEDSYQVCSNLLHILKVKHGGKLFLEPTEKNSDDINHLEHEYTYDSDTAGM